MVAWSSVISHAVYGGIAVAISGVHVDSIAPAHVSFSILTLRSIIGILNAITEENNENLQKAYEFVDKLTWFFAFPFFATHLWLAYGVRPELAYIHPAVALIPFGLYLADKDFEDASSALMLGNSISAAYVTIMQQNWYGLGATAVFAMTHGVVKFETENDNVTKEDAFNYLLAIYIILAWHGW